MPCIAEPAPLRIAVAGPFTGPYASYGSQILGGVTQAINDINHNGGLKDVKLEIVPFDDKCSPDEAIKVAEQIVASKEYQAVIGHVCSAATLASSNIYAKAKLLVITPSATNPKITQRQIATLFRMTGTDYQQGVAAANFIAKHLRSKRIAILHDHDLYSKDLADIVSENLLHFDINPIMYQAIPRGTRNFHNLVKKIKKLNADAVYFAGLYPEVSSLLTTMHALNVQIPFISGDGVAIKKFIQDAGGSMIANSVLLSFVTEPNKLLAAKPVIHNMQVKHLDTSGYALYAYASVQVIAAAIEQTNNIDSTILANWLHHNEVDTILGKKTWDTNGDIVAAEFKMYSWNQIKGIEYLDIIN